MRTFRGKRPTKGAYRVCIRCRGPGARCQVLGGFSHFYCLSHAERRERRRPASQSDATVKANDIEESNENHD